MFGETTLGSQSEVALTQSAHSPLHLVKQQRQLLTSFRSAQATHRAAIVEADELYKRTVEATDQRKTHRISTADEHLTTVKAIWERAHVGIRDRNQPKLYVLLNPGSNNPALSQQYNPSAAHASVTSAIDGLQSLPVGRTGNARVGAIAAFCIIFVVMMLFIGPLWFNVPQMANLIEFPEYYFRWYLSPTNPTRFPRDFLIVTLPPLIVALIVYRRRSHNLFSRDHRQQCETIGMTYVAAKAWNEREKQVAVQDAAAQRTRAYDAHSSETASAGIEYREALFGSDGTGGIVTTLQSTTKALDNWQHAASLGYRNPESAQRTTQLSSTVITLGETTLTETDPHVQVPLVAYVLPALDRSLSLCVSGDETQPSTFMVGCLIQLLGQVKPSRVEFTLIDPAGLGQNFAAVLSLGDHDPRSISGKVWSEPRHIDEQLTILTDHMETIIQKYLRSDFPSIDAYNEKMSEVAEPYRVLAIADFPTGFSEDAVKRLTSIVQQGPRCGVHTLLLTKPDPDLPSGVSLRPILHETLRVTEVGTQISIGHPAFADLLFDPVAPLPANTVTQIVDYYGKHAEAGRHVEVPFSRIAPPIEQWWSLNDHAREALEIPLGPSGARTMQQLALGKETSQHALVVGRTGSGKSALFHTIIVNAALHYSPADLELYLIDFKKGVEFKPYAVNALPHARVVAIESEREFGLSVLQALDVELARRGDLFRAAEVEQLSSYRSKVDSDEHGMPRILLLVDEFQEFFTADDALATQAAQILDRLVSQGRSFGIHVILGSQTLARSSMLPRSTFDQMAVRIALMCSDADSRLILADDNPMARLLSRPGEAIYNNANGRIEGNSQFQVAWLSERERDTYLRGIRRRADETERTRQRRPLVFEGNANGDVADNRQLDLALTGAVRPGRAIAWIGEPVAIRDSVGFIPMQQSGSNLLIVGQRELEALAMLLISAVSLSVTSPRDGAGPPPRFILLNFAIADSETNSSIEQFAGTMPFDVTLVRRRQLADTLTEIVATVAERLEAEQSRATPIYLLAYGLQLARDLRDADSYSFGGFDETPIENPGSQFLRILQNGPDVGVHTLAWCNSLVNLTRISPRITREFGSRVVFQSSAEDSGSLIDSAAASMLGPYRAYFYDEDRGVLEKFRPYALPPDEWFRTAASTMSAHRSS